MTGETFSASTEQLLRRLSAALVVHEGFTVEDAVRVASDVVGAGADSPSAVALAAQPVESGTRMSEVMVLYRDMLDELGRPIDQVPESGWERARWIAERIQEGSIPAGSGAFQLWRLSDDLGPPSDELVWMLQLHDAWESSDGEARRLVEEEIVAFTPKVMAAADRHRVT